MEGELSPADVELIESVARRIVARRMSAPAILLAESARPLSFVGSQFLHFLGPVVSPFVKGDAYTRFATLLEDRANVERLVSAIEAFEAEYQAGRRGAR